jgi:hypothetical protein
MISELNLLMEAWLIDLWQRSQLAGMFIALVLLENLKLIGDYRGLGKSNNLNFKNIFPAVNNLYVTF